MLEIYSAEICPFAQRTRALLTHLGVPFELHEVDLDDRDPGFLDLTPTGKVPLLVDGDLVLYESRVINAYLAEKQGWERAFAADPRLRARQRLAMKQWDDVVVPAFYASMRDPAALDEERRYAIAGEIGELAGTLDLMAPEVESLLAFHMAPHWARMVWLRSRTGLVELIGARPTVREWLDRAAAIPAVQETLPGRERTVRRYEARYVGRG